MKTKVAIMTIAPMVLYVILQRTLYIIGRNFVTCSDELLSAVITIAILPLVLCANIYLKRIGNNTTHIYIKEIMIVLIIGLLTVSLGVPGKFEMFVVVASRCLVGPINEELVYRKYAFEYAFPTFGFMTASVVSSLFFAIAHTVVWSAILAFVFGILLCWMVRKTKKTTIAILAHILFNTVIILTTGV